MSPSFSFFPYPCPFLIGNSKIVNVLPDAKKKSLNAKVRIVFSFYCNMVNKS